MKTANPATDPQALIASLEEPRRSEIAALDRFIRETVPGLDPHVRSGMLGYGAYSYKYASGTKGEWFKVGLASNKASITIYACGIMDGKYVAEAYKEKLPKASIGKSCIRFKRAADIDLDVIREILVKTAEADFGQ